jgi:hypothetical protein
MTNEPTPRAYLSTSRGQWRVIFDEMPLCADTTKANAEACARTFKISLSANYWDGEAGEFKPLDPQQADEAAAFSLTHSPNQPKTTGAQPALF